MKRRVDGQYLKCVQPTRLNREGGTIEGLIFLNEMCPVKMAEKTEKVKLLLLAITFLAHTK